MTPVTVATNTPGTPLPIGVSGNWIVISPDQAPVASFSTSGTLQTGSLISFDASASTVTFGTISSYSWNFGDGTTATGVTASHTYTSGFQYQVTLTETDSAGTSTADVFTGQTMSRNGGASAVAAKSVPIRGRPWPGTPQSPTS